VWGEIYNGMRLEDDARVLATAFDDPKNCAAGGKVCGTGKHEPVIWTYRYGNGRSIVFTPGHDERTFALPEVGQAFVACVRWAASRIP
jgi:type 1 glutamine amidotransferase